MASDSNAFHERLLAAGLTVAEWRLATALDRAILGFRRRSNRLGEALLREQAQLDGRSFARARAGLVAKGVITYEAGSRGRGKRSLYTLILTEEKPALERVNTSARKTRSKAQKNPPYSGDEEVNEEVSTPTTGADGSNEVRQLAFNAYLSAGGSLELERHRSALAGAVTAAVKNGSSEKDVLAACRDLGRNGQFPGYLKQRLAELALAGGACCWNGHQRVALTPTQLAECSCRLCGQYLAEAEQAFVPGEAS